MYPYKQNLINSKCTICSEKGVLILVKEAIKNSQIDCFYYEKLFGKVKNKDDNNIIKSIYTDKLKHKKYLENIYEVFSNNAYELKSEEGSDVSNNLIIEYQKIALNEIERLELYKQIYLNAQNPYIKDLIYEITIDIQKISFKINYLNFKYIAKK